MTDSDSEYETDSSQSSDSYGSELDAALHNTRHQDLQLITNAYIKSHPGAFTSFFMPRIPLMAKLIPKRLADTLIREFIHNHKWEIIFTFIGIALMCNPLALLGFGPLGPVAGSVAASWQSSLGSVAAGSAFSILQSMGMLYPAAISASGPAIVVVAWGKRLWRNVWN